MKPKLFSLLLIAALLLSCLTGCSTVGEIAGNVADAAKKELENQVKAVVEEYKMEVVELKTLTGKLNDRAGDVQFFCAILVRAENTTIAQSCADALDKIFQDAGVMAQSGSRIESPYLTKKDLSYTFTGFDDGSNYVTVYVYTALSLKDPVPSESK